MEHNIILQQITERTKNLGFSNYHVLHRDLKLNANQVLEIAAYNELWFVIGHPHLVNITSDYGVYDALNPQVAENAHQHRGQMQVVNQEDRVKTIQFIQVVLIN